MNGLLLGALALGDPTIDSLDVYPAYNFSVPVDHFQNESRYVEDLITLSFSFSLPCFTFMLSLIFAESVRGYPPHTSTLLLGSLDFLLEARKAGENRRFYTGVLLLLLAPVACTVTVEVIGLLLPTR